MRPTRKLTKHEREVLNLEHALLRPGLPTGYVWRNHWQTRVPLLPCPEPDARSPATGPAASTSGTTVTSRSSPGFSAILPRLHALLVAHLQLRHLDHRIATRLFIPGILSHSPFRTDGNQEFCTWNGRSRHCGQPHRDPELPILHKHNLLVVRPTCSFDIWTAASHETLHCLGFSAILLKKETATTRQEEELLFLMQNAHCEGTQRNGTR